jgi:transcriptional regulator with XRE-family HTH domain
MFRRMQAESTSGTIGHRMRSARQRIKPRLSQTAAGQAVAKAVGRNRAYTAAAVGQWENDDTKPDHNVIAAWAELTGVSVSWLINGLQHTDVQNRLDAHHPTKGRVVPKINASQAVAQPTDYDHVTTVHTHFPCSKSAFALDVFNTLNEPDYRLGMDRVVIDPEERPVIGDMVLACIDGEPVFGQYSRKRGGPEISFLNDKLADPEPLHEDRGDRIIGVMTERASPGRPQNGA